jgi:hypothetical protein
MILRQFSVEGHSKITAFFLETLYASLAAAGKYIPLAVMCVSAYMWAYLSSIDICRNRLINEW